MTLSGAYQGAMLMAIVFGLYQAFALAQYSWNQPATFG